MQIAKATYQKYSVATKYAKQEYPQKEIDYIYPMQGEEKPNSPVGPVTEYKLCTFNFTEYSLIHTS